MSSTDENENVIRVIVTDDHPMVRRGLVTLVDAQPDMTVVAEARNGHEAIDQFRRHQPGVLLMDLKMPGMGGLEATIAIRNEFPDSRIVVLTTYDGDEDIVRLLAAGAAGYLLKDADEDEILAAIRRVYAGERHIAAAVGSRLAERMSGTELTLRELELLRLMSRGGSNKDLADALQITERTVKWHVTNILDKLGATDRTMAVAVAAQRGILRLD
jgi:two-component system, NarL family, response regulator